ncbi:MAG: hypothetical protein IJY27_01995 [Clostridia bacterium]|nr:hypothetical protein [Clostridia bacterium]
MNEQQKISARRVRFNLLDGVIVLLVVLCIVGIVFRYSIMDSLGLGDEMAEYRVKFSVTGIDSTLPNYLGEGNTLYFADGVKAGKLCGISEFSLLNEAAAGSTTLVCRTASVYIDDGNGSLVLASYPSQTKIDAEGAFNCNGTYGDDSRFSIEGEKFVSVGQSVTVYTDTVTLNITITEIVPIN